MSVIDKYLAHYAEDEVSLVDNVLFKQCWDYCVVVPLKNEKPPTALFESLAQSAKASRTRVLILCVLNGLPCEQNRALQQWLWSNASSFSFLDIVAISCFSTESTLLKQGVGRARKIGCDLALALFRRSRIKNPVIHTTDADATVPLNYFSAVHFESPAAAFIYEYEHGKEWSHQLYEIFLRYYVEGLSLAGSPYAFHTIGSTICVNAESYAQVRGFPKREAGEDFYILNKLAKVGRITTLRDSVIHLQPRLSDRVPFGTGVGSLSIRTKIKQGESFTLYHPQTFSWLGLWLGAAENFMGGSEGALTRLPQPILNTLSALGAEAALKRCKNQSQKLSEQNKQFHIWFDGFRTLKFVHHLRDHCLEEWDVYKDTLGPNPYKAHIIPRTATRHVAPVG